ncbi:MAG: choice-of-anchor J domain-containing protein, partial [Dysgonamonadaceae bacterium]|nr:choice-of-anchor J domain-containing protein [Dysgonamonadaceae bacterium]
MKKWIILFTLLLTFNYAKGETGPVADGFARIIFSVDHSSNIGYQLLLDADANTFSVVPVIDMSRMDLPYNVFEYKIPADANESYNTNRVVINDTVTLDIPVGKYDFFVVYPSASSQAMLPVWTGRADDYIFETRKIYAFNLDDSETLQLKVWDAGVSSAPSALEITPHVAGMFSCTLQWTNPEITMDGSPLASLSKITILRDGEVIDAIDHPVVGATSTWVDTSVNNGTHTYSLYATNGTMNSDRITQSVVVESPSVCDGVAIFPFEEKFDNFIDYGSYPCWDIYDGEDDYSNWRRNTASQDARSGSAIGHRRPDDSGSSTQNDWLVSPKIVVPAGADLELSFWSRNDLDFGSYEDGKNSVWISTNRKNPADGDYVEVWSATTVSSQWEKITIPLSIYEGNEIYITFRYETSAGSSAHSWWIDDLNIIRNHTTDTGVTAITAPQTSSDLTSSETVTVKVKNFGHNDLSDIPVKLEIDGKLAASETIASLIAGQEETFYSFNTPVNLSVNQSYVIKAYTHLVGDENTGNNAQTVQITKRKISTFPFVEDFEAPLEFLGWGIYNLSGTSQWNIWNSASSSTSSRIGGNSIRLANVQSYQDSWLVTPKIVVPASGVCYLSFGSAVQFNNNSEDNSIWVSEESGNPADGKFTQTLWSFRSENANWTETSLSLAAYAGKEIYIAFRYQGSTHNWYIDDVRIDPLADYDAGVTTVVEPQSKPKLTNAEPITVTVKNFGSNPVENLSVGYKINELPAVTETVTGVIAALKDTVYTFSRRADLSQAQTYGITTYTSLDNDECAENDSKDLQVTNYGACEISTFPYTESFEEDSPYLNCWTSVSYGPLNKPAVVTDNLGSVRSGTQSWRFSSFFGNSNQFAYDQYLISPEMDDSKSKSVEFYYIRSDDYTQETFRVGYSTTDTQPSDFTWIQNLTALSSTAWKKCSVLIPEGAKHIAIHYTSVFKFYLYIDDLTVSELEDSIMDAGVTEVIAPRHGGESEARVTVKLRNYGSHSITAENEMKVAYKFRGGNPVIESFAGTVPSGDEVQFTFERTVDVAEYRDDYSLEVYTILSNDKNAANDTVCYNFLHRANVVLYGYVQCDEKNGYGARGAIYFNSDNDPSVPVTFSTYERSSPHLVISGEYLNDKIYAYQVNMTMGNSFYYLELTDDWVEISKRESAIGAIDMAYDYTTGTMYALVNYLPSSRLASIDLATGNVNTIIEMEKSFFTLACNLQGTLYGVDINGDFHSIDKTTGALTFIGHTGIIPGYHQSMAFDHHSGRLFWAMSRTVTDENEREVNEGKLMEIDLTTGFATLLGTIGEDAEVVALYTPFTYTAIEPVDDRSTVVLYPNPSNGVVHLFPVPEKSLISVLDLSGRKLESIANLSGNVTLNLNLADGIYF